MVVEAAATTSDEPAPAGLREEQKWLAEKL